MDPKTTDWRAGPNVCRCCLAEGCYKDISTEYFWMGKREVYAEMLSETLNLSIAYSNSGGPNSNSRLICELCISRLRDASDFKRQVQECERTFLRHLDPGSSSMVGEVEVTVEPTEIDPDVKLEHVKQEKAVSDDDDDFDERCGFDEDDDDDLDDQPLTRLASRIPKKESVDLLDLLDNTKATEKRKSSSKTKTVPAKKAKTIKKDVKATSSKAPVKTEKKKKGIIQKSNSTITVKHDDGTDIQLTVLKYPISLDSLVYESQDLDGNSDKNTDNKNKDRKLKNANIKYTNVSYLKEPVPLNAIEWKDNQEVRSSVTFNVKTVPGILYGTSRTRKKVVEDQPWKENALIMFEFSFVYPFIHANNKYKCFVCPKTFLDAVPLKNHTINEHCIKDIKRQLNNRIRDKNVKVDVTHLQCKICLQTLSNIHNLKLHLKEHGKNIDMESKDYLVPFKLGGDNFDCQVCGEKYLKLRLLIIHMNKHFNNFSCEICGSVFISLNLLQRHLKTHETGSFPCEKCDKVFNNSAKKRLHYKGVHLKEFPRRCPICPERFNSNYQRTKHLRIVHNQTTGLYRCDTCGREYDLKYHLLIHIRSVHLQERNQECPICSSRFFSKYCLSRHMVIHTGEKNYKCDVCGKAYARKKNLREHSRTHDLGLCSICGQNCGDQSNLIAHVSNMHGVL
ncbi:zinc finger protein 354A-like isoform X3 [Spodoptera litura]|uniref:Zinc finger protein 354A-like isoform X3 n=1 Tax=Spodoptera litura TaxID=69820 RepID=A0A9J7DZL3_SPOLT|nr:zinc finger protein 354A-like isoform X3 [Spodoptera litura]